MKPRAQAVWGLARTDFGFVGVETAHVMHTIRILSIGCSLMIGAILFSGCATTRQSSSQSQETKSKRDDMTAGEKTAAYFSHFFQTFAYGLGQSGFSFVP